LRALLKQVKGGQGQVVVVSGEAGIGKSRLVMEARAIARAEDFLVMQGSCFPTDRNCPYAPGLDLLRAYPATDLREHVVAELGPLAAAFFPLLPDASPQPSELAPLPTLGAATDKRRLFTAMSQVF